MNWTAFRKYLESNIIHLTTRVKGNITKKGEKIEIERDVWTISPRAKEEYNISEEQADDMATILHNFAISCSASEGREIKKSIILTLPVEYEEGKEWADYFPDWQEMKFGVKNETLPLNEENFTILGKIFDDWQGITNLSDKDKVGKLTAEENEIAKISPQNLRDNNWFTNLPWKQIAFWGTGGIILLVIGVIIHNLYNINKRKIKYE